jgi:Uma2 family endonuclease
LLSIVGKIFRRKNGEQFPLVTPDFVIELRSKTDRIKPLQTKMEEYRAAGVKLGWLIDPFKKTVYVYRPSSDVETLSNPTSVSGDPTLPGFKLDLADVFSEEE